jgi:putative ABC transport system permease protein
VVGSDLAQRTGLKPGDPLSLSGPGGELHARVSALVTTGGEEDGLLFVALPELQRMRGDDNRLTMVRLLVTSTGNSVGQAAAALKPLLPRAEIKAVRQVAHTSEGLLRKIQLLMLLVTVVVLVSAGSSVASTMSATVLERGKEIGLMKAVGGSRGDLLLIFAGEALLLGLAGGAAGWLCGNAIAQFVTRAVFSAPAEIIPSGLLVSWGVSLFLCILGSVVPMMSVFRLDPVRSLRGE